MQPIVPTGKCMVIWNISQCAGGIPEQIAIKAKQAGFSRVSIKAADGIYKFNQGSPPSWGGPDLLMPTVLALHAVGIFVDGWQYIYGANWLGQSQAAAEAAVAIECINRFAFDAWYIDPEKEYKRKGSAAWADTYMNALRAGCPHVSIGLNSYRYPTYHPELPWHNFLRHCNFHSPQVYWILAHNSGDQLRKSYRELKALADLPVVPMGSAYYDTGYKWQPTIPELNQFDMVAHELQCPGITWWEWGENGHGAEYVPGFWDAISAHQWGEPPAPPDLTIEQKMTILWREAGVRSWNLIP